MPVIFPEENNRCAIGRALMSKPILLIIDELSLGLAPVVVDDLIETIIRLRDEEDNYFDSRAGCAGSPGYRRSRLCV